MVWGAFKNWTLFYNNSTVHIFNNPYLLRKMCLSAEPVGAHSSGGTSHCDNKGTLFWGNPDFKGWAHYHPVLLSCEWKLKWAIWLYRRYLRDPHPRKIYTLPTQSRWDILPWMYPCELRNIHGKHSQSGCVMVHQLTIHWHQEGPTGLQRGQMLIP